MARGAVDTATNLRWIEKERFTCATSYGLGLRAYGVYRVWVFGRFFNPNHENTGFMGGIVNNSRLLMVQPLIP